jgi:hypothetical protein
VEALKRLDAKMADPAWVAGFEKPATDPSAFLEPSTTVLSPYLKFGCLSARLFHSRLLATYRSLPPAKPVCLGACAVFTAARAARSVHLLLHTSHFTMTMLPVAILKGSRPLVNWRLWWWHA